MIDIKQYKDNEVKYLFEKQKKELTQSLMYASYIQKALLPSENAIKRLFPEHFLFYIPRDIVSGDFYWISKKGNKVFLSVADCTGHGVPGAFLSILGISYLNQIVDRFNDLSSAAVLNMLREFLMKALKQTGRENEQKDGIDMSLCAIDTAEGYLEYAGAFNPMYIIQKDNYLLEVAGDKMPIGIAAEIESSFVNYTTKLNSGDMVYLFSDGFVDQFGGPNGKKYKYRPFRNLLLNINSLSMSEQKLRLSKAFNEWKGNLSQLDDVLIFGFRYV